MAYRLGKMAHAMAHPHDADAVELNQMIVEKQVAFWQAWTAMGLHGMSAAQNFSQQWLRWSCMPWTSPAALTPLALTGQLQASLLEMATKGLAPVRRKAVANSRRLARRR
ncbi:hypothetical protein D8I35_06070 [Corticibacter populi]|uniref:Phasin domain-containing protein n=2 Tax=Corticibacter populi TaxID=1550736 RepID=A0A3M6R155_9BURK|nr:hypothetical protein D8I35_06070 [Corticibacter populi]